MKNSNALLIEKLKAERLDLSGKIGRLNTRLESGQDDGQRRVMLLWQVGAMEQYMCALDVRIRYEESVDS